MAKAMDFRGRWVLVTGASAGLGREFARQLAHEHGANLIVLARRKERLEELRTELEQSAGVRVIPLVADLSQSSDVTRVLAEIVNGPPVYAAILNAAVTHFGPQALLPSDTFDAMLSTNVTSVVRFADALVPHIISKQPGGGILFVASMAGLQPVPYQSAYSGTKAFMIHFACGLWHELRKQPISITSFAPGGIDTEMTAGESFVPLKGFLVSAEQCAREGLNAFRRRDYLYVNGFSNRFGAGLGKLLPRRFVTGLVARTYRRALEASAAALAAKS
ncbi:MAG: SDR family NAD(P)-dependent oxidoreductase [Pseudomonadota bacterium]